MKVLVSIPNTSYIHKHVAMAAMRILADHRYQVRVIMPTWVPFEHSMNRIAKDVLDGDADYWLNIDSDNPPMRNPLDLVELQRDIIGLPTPIYHNDGEGYPICWSAMDMVEDGYREHPDKRGLQQVDAVGTGCLLISRRVIEAMEAPWFVREYDEWGRTAEGPDFRFCRKAGELGFQVWAHYDYPCRHFNELELTEAIEAFARTPVNMDEHVDPDSACLRSQ